MANKKRQKRLTVTKLCSQCDLNTHDDTAKLIESTLCPGWIHMTSSYLIANKFDLLNSSPTIIYACDNCLNSNEKLTVTAAELHFPKKDIVNCLNDKLSKPRF